MRAALEQFYKSVLVMDILRSYYPFHKDDLSGGVYAPLASWPNDSFYRRANFDEYGVFGYSSRHPTPPPIVPRPSPNAPNPNYPPGLQGPEQTPPDPKKLDRQNRAEIQADVQKLYELIGELKEQVERSDTSSTLSLSVVKKAQQIEKLANQVKDRAKG